jgi:hypothetical protein
MAPKSKTKPSDTIDALPLTGEDDLTKKRAALDKALLGYSCINLLELGTKLQWGKYNDRVLNLKQAQDLALNFLEHGLDVTDRGAMIPIAVRKSWCAPASFRPNITGYTTLQIPMLELTKSGSHAILDGSLVPFGGRHRFKALQLYSTKLDSNLKAATRKYNSLVKSDEAPGESRIHALEHEIAILKSSIEQAKRWVVCIWDLGEKSLKYDR